LSVVTRDHRPISRIELWQGPEGEQQAIKEDKLHGTKDEAISTWYVHNMPNNNTLHVDLFPMESPSLSSSSSSFSSSSFDAKVSAYSRMKIITKFL
jgi:hypothetical protein